MIRSSTIALLFGLFLTTTGHGQHSPLTSQYLFNGLLINPAYAGSHNALTTNLTMRRQWVGMEGAPATEVLSVHAPISSQRIGIGAMVYNDRIGVSRETGFHTSYAYRMHMGRNRLSFGIGAGLSVLQADWSEVALQDQSDVAYATNEQGTLRPNFSAGAYYYTKRFFVGASLPFFMSRTYDPENGTWTMTNDPSQYQPMLTGGYVIDLDREFKLKPSALVRYQRGGLPSADLTCNLIYKDKLWTGVSYRIDDAVVAMFEVLPTPQWRFGYAYDLGISALRAYNGGSHELMVQYEFGYRIRVKDPRYF